MNAVQEPSFESLLAELHAAVKTESSVPKVADAIGMNYYSLRDNLIGKSEIRLKTFYDVLRAINLTSEELTQRARLREARSED